jgi:hypothetical protein
MHLTLRRGEFSLRAVLLTTFQNIFLVRLDLVLSIVFFVCCNRLLHQASSSGMSEFLVSSFSTPSASFVTRLFKYENRLKISRLDPEVYET